MAYTGKDLETMGLKKRVQTLVYRQPGQFMVDGIQQVPGTNHYVFLIEKITEKGNGTETISLDITTGKMFSDDSKKGAEPKRSTNGSLTNRWSQPLAVVMSTFDFVKQFSMFATLAAASGGSAPSR